MVIFHIIIYFLSICFIFILLLSLLFIVNKECINDHIFVFEYIFFNSFKIEISFNYIRYQWINRCLVNFTGWHYNTYILCLNQVNAYYPHSDSDSNSDHMNQTLFCSERFAAMGLKYSLLSGCQVALSIVKRYGTCSHPFDLFRQKKKFAIRLQFFALIQICSNGLLQFVV